MTDLDPPSISEKLIDEEFAKVEERAASARWSGQETWTLLGLFALSVYLLFTNFWVGVLVFAVCVWYHRSRQKVHVAAVRASMGRSIGHDAGLTAPGVDAASSDRKQFRPD